MFLSQNSIPTDRNFSKVCPNCVLAKTRLQTIETTLRDFKIVFGRKVNRTWWKLIQDLSKLIRSPNSNASYRLYSETIPNCVLAEIQLHLIERILRQLPIVSQPKFNCILSKTFYNFPQLCLSQNSFEVFAKTSRTIPKCCSARIQLHLIKIIPRYVQKDS